MKLPLLFSSEDEESMYRARSVRFSGSTRAIAHSAFDGMFYVFVSSLVARVEPPRLLLRRSAVLLDGLLLCCFVVLEELFVCYFGSPGVEWSFRARGLPLSFQTFYRGFTAL